MASKGLITVQPSYNKRTHEYKSTKAGYWRTVPISSELAFLLRNIVLKDEFVLSKIETWVQGQQARVLREFCRKISIPAN